MVAIILYILLFNLLFDFSLFFQSGNIVPISVNVGDKVLLPEYGGTKVTMEEKVWICFVLFVLFWWGVWGYNFRAWWENEFTVTNSLQTSHLYHLEVILNIIGYFVAIQYSRLSSCNCIFFPSLIFTFGREMKNYTGDQKSKIIFFSHLSLQ